MSPTVLIKVCLIIFYTDIFEVEHLQAQWLYIFCIQLCEI